MPLVKIHHSSTPPAEEAASALLTDLSRRLAGHLGKPEAYVMTCLMPPARMTFGGSPEPCCYVEVKSVGRIDPARTQAMSADLCERLQEALGIPTSRIYIEFAEAEGRLWGYDRETF